MKHLRTTLIVALASLAFAGAALAAPPVHHHAVTDDEDTGIRPVLWAAYGSDTNFGIGGGIVVPLTTIAPHLNLVAGFTYHFPSADNLNITDDTGITTAKTDGKYWQIHADVLRDFKLTNSSVRPYVGAGIAYAHASASVTISDGDTSETISATNSSAILDIVGGATFGTGKIKPFVQATLQVESGSQILFTAGLRF